MANPESIVLKSAVRQQMRQTLRDNARDSAAVVRQIDDWLTPQLELQTLAVYSALPDEADLSELVARHPERHWIYPRVAGDLLVFHLVKNPATDLISGAFGIREPSPDLPEIAVADIDAFFCPGLAFDFVGGRLGRGKGFYDRMLAGARRGALKIGVGFPCQIVGNTHAENHDVRMDRVFCGG